MKLVRFVRENLVDYGFVVGGTVVPHGSVKMELPPTLDDLVRSGLLASPEALISLNTKVAASKDRIPLKKVKLLHPLERPGKIVCLGRNYPEPSIESGTRMPKGLVIFLKPSTALTGPYDPILLPRSVRMLDYEGELVVVVGRTAKGISADEAAQVVLGYTIMNDVSARDVQILDRQWTRGKGFDTFAPMGPWITTKEEIPVPLSLYIKTWVNEDLRQEGSTSNMMRKVDQIIAELSESITVEAGDVISTGTPEGVGFYMKPNPRLLSPGDKVRVEIERLGYIENTVLSS